MSVVDTKYIFEKRLKRSKQFKAKPMKTPLLIDRKNAIEFLLRELYYSEFEVIDRCNQHPRGLSFYRWLYEKKLIDTDNLKEIEAELKRERELNPDDWDQFGLSALLNLNIIDKQMKLKHLLLKLIGRNKQFNCYEIHRPNIPNDGCKTQCKECAERDKQLKSK